MNPTREIKIALEEEQIIADNIKQWRERKAAAKDAARQKHNEENLLNMQACGKHFIGSVAIVNAFKQIKL